MRRVLESQKTTAVAKPGDIRGRPKASLAKGRWSCVETSVSYAPEIHRSKRLAVSFCVGDSVDTPSKQGFRTGTKQSKHSKAPFHLFL